MLRGVGVLETGGADQPQRYCTNCGAQVRPGTAFCVSCGASLTPGAQEVGPTNPGPTPSEGSSLFDTLLVQLRRAVNRLREILSGVDANDLRRLPGRILGWFRDLPSVLTLVLVGSIVVILAVLLSPLAALISALVFGVSVIALIVRVAQRGSVKGWGTVAVASLVLMFAFGGISGALYGTGFVGSSAPDTGDANEVVGGGPAEGVDDGPAYTASPEGAAQDGTVYGSMDPELEKIIDDWHSSGTESPLFLPTHVPFPVAEVEVHPSAAGQQDYFIWSDSTIGFSSFLRMVLIGPATAPSSYFSQGTIEIDGRYYPYAEDESVTGDMDREPGHYVVLLWVDTEQGEEYMYQVEMNTAAYLSQNPLPIEEFVKVVTSMERLDPSDV
jgi:hypothetical protein